MKATLRKQFAALGEGMVILGMAAVAFIGAIICFKLLVALAQGIAGTF